MGLSLGMLGSGGAILAVPILVYFFQLEATVATSYSLGIVGLTSLIGAYNKAKKKEWDLKKAWPLGLASTAGLIVSRMYLLPATPEIISVDLGFTYLRAQKSELILFLFASLLILVGRKMLRASLMPNHSLGIAPTNKNLPLLSLIILGVLIGMLAGFMGAGGGFFFIPLLTLGMGISMHKAVGTSLVIIAFNSLTGFTIDIFLKNQSLDFKLYGVLLIFSFIGVLLGTYYATRVNDKKLRKSFAVFLLVLGLTMMLDRFFLRKI